MSKDVLIKCADCGFIADELEFAPAPDIQYCPKCGANENRLADYEE